MKKILFLILLSFPLFASAQHFLDSNKTWSVLQCSTGGGTACMTSKYKLMIDTIVTGITFYRLYESFDSTGTNWNPTSDLLSEDTLTKKVFFNGSGNILYDFLLNKGDTIQPAGPFGGCFPVVVDSVDTVLYWGILRRRIIFDASGGQFSAFTSWIDGIGGTDGIIQSFIRTCMVDADAHLLCCDSAGVRIYQSSLFNSCNVTLGTDELENKSLITVTPNPFFDRIFINAPGINGTDLHLEIFDPAGRAVFSSTVPSTEMEIRIPPLANGIYFITFQNENIYSVNKMVKTD